ncbi:putative calcium-transporting ATPase 11, plasma membrane-type [Rutidosis leptorrhynchoides]|uniref:putative calcium-transporting ATPase 11, plasma membrane-type n=1 Tax=Rutidosis leptorrhynchoides TaxID=125765 RepID=UPI003A993E80
MFSIALKTNFACICQIETKAVHINKEKPFLLNGSKVQDGLGKMLVAAVGMRTEWGKLMETLSVEGENETPLQVKLNSPVTIIGKIRFRGS